MLNVTRHSISGRFVNARVVETHSFALERDREVGLDDRRDVPWPDHGSVAAEVDDFAIGNVERAIVAGVPAGPDGYGVTSWLEWRLDRFMTFE